MTKKLFIPLLGFFMLAGSVMALEAEEKVLASPPDEEAATEEVGKKAEAVTEESEKKAEVATEKEEEVPPSEEAKKAAKGLKMTFDPQTYTCKQFVEDVKKAGDSELLKLAAIWAHGYFSSTWGTDEMGALSEKSAAESIQWVMDTCKEDPASNFSRAVYKAAEDDEE